MFIIFLMIRRPPRPTRTDTLCPYATPSRSRRAARLGRDRAHAGAARCAPAVGIAPQRGLYPRARRHDRQPGNADGARRLAGDLPLGLAGRGRRSEEHTSELQSLMRISYAVFCLKKTKSLTDNKKRHDY